MPLLSNSMKPIRRFITLGVPLKKSQYKISYSKEKEGRGGLSHCIYAILRLWYPRKRLIRYKFRESLNQKLLGSNSYIMWKLYQHQIKSKLMLNRVQREKLINQMNQNFLLRFCQFLLGHQIFVIFEVVTMKYIIFSLELF